MASFRLSDRARAELVAIYDSSEAHFGPYQADAYLAGLERTFGLLADFPGIGKAADHLKAGTDAFGFRHISSSTARIVIRAVIHEARNQARAIRLRGIVVA